MDTAGDDANSEKRDIIVDLPAYQRSMFDYSEQTRQTDCMNTSDMNSCYGSDLAKMNTLNNSKIKRSSTNKRSVLAHRE